MAGGLRFPATNRQCPCKAACDFLEGETAQVVHERVEGSQLRFGWVRFRFVGKEIPQTVKGSRCQISMGDGFSLHAATSGNLSLPTHSSLWVRTVAEVPAHILSLLELPYVIEVMVNKEFDCCFEVSADVP
jgi:hypothetical protein